MNMPQRRRWDRIRRELDVVVRVDGSQSAISGKTLDICEGGIGVLCHQSLTVGKDYQFEILQLTAKSMTGTVRWCTPAPSRGANHIGVELAALSEQQIADVRSAVERWKGDESTNIDA